MRAWNKGRAKTADERSKLSEAVGGKTIAGTKRSLAERAAIMATKPEVCDCCGGPPVGRYDTLHLDHDHTTNDLRGWLCHKCNSGIGLLGDDLESIKRVVAYLENPPLARRLWA